MRMWLAMALAGAGTFAIRSALVVASGSGEAVAERLRFAAPAVTAALVSTSLFTAENTAVMPPFADLVAVGVCAAAIRRSGNVGLGLVSGLVTFVALSVTGVA